MQLACCCHSTTAGARPRCRLLLLLCVLPRLLPTAACTPLPPLRRNTVLGRWDADTTRFLTEEECVGELARRQLRVRSCSPANAPAAWAVPLLLLPQLLVAGCGRRLALTF